MAAARIAGNADAAFEALGPLRCYNMVQYFLLCITVWSVALNMFSVVFTGQANPFRCRRTLQNITFDNLAFNSSGISTEIDFDSTCIVKTFSDESGNASIQSNLTETETCSAFDVEFLFPKDMYFVSEFNLVCEREYLIGLTQTILTLGQFIATFIFPYFTDRYGRKPVVISSCFLILLSSIGLACSMNYEMFIAFKLLMGIFVQGMEAATVTALTETLVTRHRAFMFSCIGSCNWTFSCLLLAPIAYILRHHPWRILEFTIGAFSLCGILLLLFLDETLRWLSANGRTKRVLRVLERASRWNCVDLKKVKDAFYNSDPDSFETDEAMLSPVSEDSGNKAVINSPSHEPRSLQMESFMGTDTPNNGFIASNSGVPQREEHLSFKHLFTDSMLRRHIVFGIFSWFFNSLTYFALILMSSTLHGSIYVNYTLNVIVEVPQAFYGYFYLNRVGRRKSFSLFSVIAGVTLIASAIVWQVAPEQNVALTVLSIIGKFGITGSFNVIYLYIPELYPTNLRNMGMGVSYMSARVGGMLSPFAELLMKKVVYAPGLVFGISSLFLSLTPFFLPETTEHQLPQTLGEMKLWKLPGGPRQ